MARINQALLKKLGETLSVRRSRVYKMIEQKVAETHLDRHLAAVVLASENGINISKYATPGELATIRGTPSHPIPASSGTPQPVKRSVIKSIVPIVVDLKFVSSNELREILQRDIAELNSTRSQGLEKTSKMCMVLCGSIAEALLLDRLLQNQQAALATASSLAKKPSSNLEEWDLYEMVTVAQQLGFLSADTSTGANQLRKWRNLIHPGRELRETRNNRIKPTLARAQNSIAFLQLIVEELG